MNKFTLLSAALLLSQAAFSDDFRIQERVSALEDELYAMRTPPSYTEPNSFCSPSGVFVNKGEFLWLKTYTRTLPYALQADVDFANPAFAFVTANQHLRYVYFPSSPGFRIGMGYIFDFAKWEFDLLWTRISTYGTSSVFSGGGTTAVVLIQTQNLGNPNPLLPQFASAQAKIKINAVDFEASRTFWPSDHTSLRPVFGLRFASISHSMDSYYEGFDNTDPFTDSIYQKRKIRGGGLRMGGDFKLLILKGWEIYSNGFVSLLLAKQRESTDETISLIAGEGEFTKYDSFRRLITNLQLGAGLKWGSYLWGEKTYLSLQAGYEATTWTNYDQMTTFFLQQGAALRAIDSDLDMAGWVFGAKLLY